MKTTTRTMTMVVAVIAMAMVTGACRGGPNGPDYPDHEVAAAQNQPFTPHSVSVGR